MAIRIRNWEKHQHFRDRTPPWIKLYRDILDDPDWHSLDGESVKTLVGLWLIASEDSTRTGTLPDLRKVAFRLRISEDKLNQQLAKLSHWLERDDIRPLSARYQDDAPETETETETENNPSGCLSSADDCPHAEIVKLYHEILPANPRMKVWNGQRAKHLRARWREEPKRQSLDYWRRFFEKCAASRFLTGQTVGKDGRAFLPGLDWLILPTNFAKVIEGRYDD